MQSAYEIFLRMNTLCVSCVRACVQLAPQLSAPQNFIQLKQLFSKIRRPREVSTSGFKIHFFYINRQSYLQNLSGILELCGCKRNLQRKTCNVDFTHTHARAPFSSLSSRDRFLILSQKLYLYNYTIQQIEITQCFLQQ